jgi:hydroxypyruvate reductase
VTARAVEALSGSLAAEPHVWALAAGKASVGMATAIDLALGERLRRGVLTAHTAAPPSPRWRAYAASHPRPDHESEAAGRAALALADAAAREGALLMVGLSGGASAMLAVPAEGLTIDDTARTTAVLLAAGVDIGEMNLVRRHLSAIKGGQLAARAGRTITLAISDVCTPVEDDPAVIGSGPTWGDDSSFAEALGTIERYGLADAVPPAVLAHLRRGAAGEVAGPVPRSDPRLRQAAYWLAASRHDAMRAAGETAARLGYQVTTVPAPVIGDAREAAVRLVETARGLSRPACLVASGETTVKVRGTGRGGRNQEFALAALEPLSRLAPAMLASVGTDGIDGPTDAAGALVDDGTWRQLGPSAAERVRQALDDNDAYPVLDSVGALLRTGPTGTNVGDLQVILLGEDR